VQLAFDARVVAVIATVQWHHEASGTDSALRASRDALAREPASMALSFLASGEDGCFSESCW
jgi:hypothetical protein